MSPLFYAFQISETTERINIEKLKTHERIFFFQDIILFEDELSDNGDSNLSVKVVSLNIQEIIIIMVWSEAGKSITLKEVQIYSGRSILPFF